MPNPRSENYDFALLGLIIYYIEGNKMILKNVNCSPEIEYEIIRKNLHKIIGLFLNPTKAHNLMRS